jgi:hypothetical protein
MHGASGSRLSLASNFHDYQPGLDHNFWDNPV